MDSKPTNPAMGRFIAGILANSRERRARADAIRPEIEAAEAKLKRQATEALASGRVAHLAACGVEERALSVVRQGFEETPAIQAAREWMRSNKAFLVLWGTAGSGKTVAASLTLLKATRRVEVMAHELADEPVCFEEFAPAQGLFVSAAELRHSSRYSDEPRASPVLEKAKAVRWLVVDELRAADLKGAGLERFEEVLVARYGAAKRTVLTTNLTPTQMVELLASSERLASRFAEGADFFNAGNDDLRQQKPNGKAVTQ